MTILAPPEPTASILSSPPATRVVRWRCRGVAALAAADLAAIEAILRDHAAASVVERRERAMHERLGLDWTPVVIEAGGRRMGRAEEAAAALSRGAPTASLRTFSRSASVTFGRFGVAVRLDDDPALAKDTMGRIRRLVGPRRDRVADCLEAAWTVPAIVLGLPVLSSLLDGDGHAGRTTWEGMAVAVAILLAWLCWRHLVWLERRLSPAPPDPRADALPVPSPPAGDGVASGVTRS